MSRRISVSSRSVLVRLKMVVLLLSVGTAAYAAPITISLVPTSASVALEGSSDPLVLDIMISNPDGLAVKSWSLDLKYDPGVFNSISGIGTIPPNGFQLGDYLQGQSITPNYNPNYDSNKVAPDVARMGATNFGTTTNNAASGRLASVAVDAIALSPGSTVWLTGQILGPSGAYADAVLGSAQILVIPEPVTAALLCAGMLGVRRRRR